MAPKKRRAQSRPPLVKTVPFDGELLDGHALDAMIAESEERLERLRSAKRSLTTNYFEVLPAELRPLVLAQLLLHAERPAAYARVCTAWLSDWRDKQPLQQKRGSTSPLPQAGTFIQPCGHSLLLTGCTSTWLSMPTSNTFLAIPPHAARRFAACKFAGGWLQPPMTFAQRQIQGAAFSSDGSTVYLIDWSEVPHVHPDGDIYEEGCVAKLKMQEGGSEYNQVAYASLGTHRPGPGIALDEAAGQVIVPLRGAGLHGEHVVLLDLDLKVLGRYPHPGVPKKDLFEDGVQTAAVSGGRIAVADSYNHRVQLLRRDPADPARLQLERHVNQGMKRKSEFPWGVILEQDHLFVTSVNQATIKVYLAATGALLQQVESPTTLAGLCRFGGSLLAMPYTADEGTDQVVRFEFKA